MRYEEGRGLKGPGGRAGQARPRDACAALTAVPSLLAAACGELGSDSLAGRDLTPYRANRADEFPEPAIGSHCPTPRWRSRCSRLAPYTRPTARSRGIIRRIPGGERILEGGEVAHSREALARCFKTPPKRGSAFASLQDPPAAVYATPMDVPPKRVCSSNPSEPVSSPDVLARLPFTAPPGQDRMPNNESSGTGPTDGPRLHILLVGPRIGRRPHPSLPAGGPARRSCQGVSGKSPETGPRRTVLGAVKIDFRAWPTILEK